MSNREKAMALLENVPDYKMGYVVAYLQGLTADEEADDLYCQRLAENYRNDPDPEKDTEYSLEDCNGGLSDVPDCPEKACQKVYRQTAAE